MATLTGNIFSTFLNFNPIIGIFKNIIGVGGNGGYLRSGSTNMFYLRPDGSYYVRP